MLNSADVILKPGPCWISSAHNINLLQWSLNGAHPVYKLYVTLSIEWSTSCLHTVCYTEHRMEHILYTYCMLDWAWNDPVYILYERPDTHGICPEASYGRSCNIQYQLLQHTAGQCSHFLPLLKHSSLINVLSVNLRYCLTWRCQRRPLTADKGCISQDWVSVLPGNHWKL